MAVAETTMAPAPSATADIDRRLNTLVSLVEQRTADLTTMTAAVNKAAASADKTAATVAANLGDHGSLPTTYVPTPVPVLVETSSTPTLQPFVVPKPKPSTPTKCSMECRDAETYQVMPTLLRDLSSPAILSFRSESMYLPAPPPHPPEQPCSGQILVPKSLSWPSFQFVTSLRCNTELWLADTQPWGRNAFSPGYDEERHMVHMLDDAIQTQSSSRTKSNSDILDSPITMQAMLHYEEQCEQWDPGIHLVCGLLGNLIYFQGMQDIILSMQCTSWEFTVPPKWLSGPDGRIFVGGLLLHVFWTNLLDLVEKSFSFAGGIDGTTMRFYHGNTFQNSEATGGVLCNGVKRCREDDLLFIQVLVPVDFWCLGYVQAYLTKLWRCDYHRMINGDQANLSVAYESTRTCIQLAPSDILPSVSLLHAYWYCTRTGTTRKSTEIAAKFYSLVQSDDPPQDNYCLVIVGSFLADCYSSIWLQSIKISVHLNMHFLTIIKCRFRIPTCLILWDPAAVKIHEWIVPSVSRPDNLDASWSCVLLHREQVIAWRQPSWSLTVPWHPCEMQPILGKCAASWSGCWFPYHHNTSKWQQRHWHVHMMVSFALELSKDTQILPTGGIDCAGLFRPYSLLPMLVHDAHSSTKNMLSDSRAVGASCEKLFTRPSFTPAIKIRPVHIIADELIAHFVSGAVNCRKSRVVALNINIALSNKFFSLWSMGALCSGHIGRLVSLSITITMPRYPCVFNWLIGEAMHSKLAYQQTGEYAVYGSVEHEEETTVQWLLCLQIFSQQKLGSGFHAGIRSARRGCAQFRPVLRKPSTNSHWLWDPGGCHPQSAWGQAEIQGEGNVTDQVHMSVLWWIKTWAGLCNGADLLPKKPKTLLVLHKGMSRAREGHRR